MSPPAKTTSRRRGRRQGEPVSREAVLRAAKQRFAVEGYEKTTLRAIANDARVDPSMVLYLFGSKAELFRESLRLIIDPEVLVAALAEGDDDIGTRMVRTYLGIWEHQDTGASMVAMLQSATSNPDAHEAFRAFMQSYVLTAVSDALGGGEQARLRAMLAATNLVGTAILRYVMRVPPLATLPADDVVKLIGPSVTRYLTASARGAGSARAIGREFPCTAPEDRSTTRMTATSVACWRSIQSLSRVRGSSQAVAGHRVGQNRDRYRRGGHDDVPDLGDPHAMCCRGRRYRSPNPLPHR